MSESMQMMSDAASRLFSELSSKAVTDAAEGGTFPAALWDALEEAGFHTMLVAERDGGSGASPADAAEILRIAGRYSAAVPLLETALARWLLSEAGAPAPEGPLTMALGCGTRGWRLEGAGEWRELHGKEPAVPWARSANALVFVIAETSGSALAIVPTSDLEITPRLNIAGEPRDDVAASGLAVRSATWPWSVSRVLRRAALLRGAMILGALENLLDMTVRYASERVQFGRPLAKLQAVQQQLAVLAGSVAASSAITTSAAHLVDRDDGELMVAIQRARLADAIDTATGIAHQVHGAIGFAREYGLHLSTRRLWGWRDEYGTAAHWREYVGSSFVGISGDGLWPALAAVGRRAA